MKTNSRASYQDLIARLNDEPLKSVIGETGVYGGVAKVMLQLAPIRLGDLAQM